MNKLSGQSAAMMTKSFEMFIQKNQYNVQIPTQVENSAINELKKELPVFTRDLQVRSNNVR